MKPIKTIVDVKERKETLEKLIRHAKDIEDRRIIANCMYPQMGMMGMDSALRSSQLMQVSMKLELASLEKLDETD